MVSVEDDAKKLLENMSNDYIKNFTNEKSATPAMWCLSHHALLQVNMSWYATEELQTNQHGLAPTPENIKLRSQKLNEIGINDCSTN